VTTMLDELVRSLLYEGYALYPYTPGAAKNATPTPFGIVYPPAYALRNRSTFDHLQVECVLVGAPGCDVGASVHFLQATGEGHRAVERRVDIDGAETAFGFDGLRGCVLFARERLDEEHERITLRVLNETPFHGEGRAEALTHSLVSTHPVLRAHDGRFLSPLEAEGCENVNTWPVLASPGDDVVVGGAIFLPDPPRIAPESHGDLFDGTEIEEALLLHVHALSDVEREAIDDQDDPVRELIARASATGAEEIARVHGELRPSAPAPGFDPGFDPREGEAEALVDGRRFRRNQQVVLRLEDRTDPYDQLLAGRTATIERIYLDVDGRVYLGVTIDSDPMQEVMRETGRYHFFFPDEVELVGNGTPAGSGLEGAR